MRKLLGFALTLLLAANMGVLAADAPVTAKAAVKEAPAKAVVKETPTKAAVKETPTKEAAPEATPTKEVSAKETAVKSDSATWGKWLIQLEGGMQIPASSQASSQMNAGFAGEGQLGYAFSPEFSLSVESGFDVLPVKSDFAPDGQTLNVYHVPLEAVGQYNLNLGGAVSPYIVVGVGVAFDSLNTSATLPAGQTTSWTNFELDPGLGVNFKLGESVGVFVQGKVAMDFETTSGDKAQLSDNPLINIPVEAGVNFLL